MDRYTLGIGLWIHDGQQAALEAFRLDEARLIEAFGGRHSRVVRMASTPQGLFEYHVISFPDQAGFEAYRSSDEVRAMSARRDAIVRRAEEMEIREDPNLRARDPYSSS
jgi:hypothetical protein